MNLDSTEPFRTNEEAPASPAAPVRCIVFRDMDRLWYRVDRTGFNKVGYVTRRDTVVHPRLNRSLTESPLRVVTRHPYRILRRSASSQADLDNVERFFVENVPSIELFNAGMSSITSDPDLSFFRNPIRIPALAPVADAEFERRWAEFRNLLRQGDMIFVVDRKSLVSRLIARFDHGTWSHVALYSGHGTVIEAITEGVVESWVDTYHDPRYRIGLYRISGLGRENAARIIASARSQVAAKYNFRGLVRLATLKLLGVKLDITDPSKASPNDLARSDRLRLVHIV